MEVGRETEKAELALPVQGPGREQVIVGGSLVHTAQGSSQAGPPLTPPKPWADAGKQVLESS